MSARRIELVADGDGRWRELIDRGCQVNKDLKVLQEEDKQIKTDLNEIIEQELGKGETHIVLGGDVHSVEVIVGQSLKLDITAENFKQVEEAAAAGVLDPVKCKKILRVPECDIEKATDVLIAAGISATFSREFSLDSKAYKGFTGDGSPEKIEAKQALDSCIKKSQTFRIKYEE